MDVESHSGVIEDRDNDTDLDMPPEAEYCDVCNPSSKSVSMKYCKECEEKLCEACIERHALRKATSSHKLVPLNEMLKAETYFCTPCNLGNKTVTALKFCKECEEYLCEGCINSHKSRKATRFHEPVAVELLSDNFNESENTTILCQPCRDMGQSSRAARYCKECEEYLCDGCTYTHKRRNATKLHEPIAVDQLSDHSRETANTTPLCQPCRDIGQSSRAARYCKECEEYLCDGCTDSHKKRRATKLHEPVAVEQLDLFEESGDLKPCCQPCEDLGHSSHALKYCKDCDEYLCNKCTTNHSIRNATASHAPVPVSSLASPDENRSRMKECKFCDLCIILGREAEAKSFCPECEELLCVECTKKHKTSKFTKSHELKDSECVEYVSVDCDICDNTNTKAVMFCKTCEENLCDLCATKHKKQTITRDHSLETVHGKTIREKLMCTPCQENETIIRAKTFCRNCDEFLCESCTRHHKVQRITKQHELISPESALFKNERTCDMCAIDKKQVKASKFCLQCSEALCVPCERRHKSQKMAKDHKIVSVTEAPKVKSTECDQCEEGGQATKYCVECQNNLCSECCKTHKRMKVFSNHKLKDVKDTGKSKQKDCDSCQEPESVDIYCTECKEFYCNKCSKQHSVLKATRNHHLVSVEDVKKEDVLMNDEREKDREFGAVDNRNVEANTQSEKKQDRPGKPQSSNVLADSVTLSWDPPSKFEAEDYYQISYKDKDHEKKWKFKAEEFKSSTAVLNDLKSNTTFIFRVRVVYQDGEGPYSENSEEIITSDSPASRILQFSKIVEKGDPSPTKYALPITEVRTARNEKAKTKRFELGSPPQQVNKSKTIMLVGATGTGKSTLVDGIVNYVLGVNWDDRFRFTVIDLEQEEKDRLKNQALSQTEWITCYTLNPEKGSRLQYQLNIIDTPGFGDTRGLKRDQEIVEQIRQLFSEKQPKGVTFIDCVCFLIKAPDARLTAIQSYIFQSVMSLFGKDIEKNICSLITFADGIDPPVLAALRESGLPFGESFTFNNSGLFAKNSNLSEASLSPMFWNMGLKSFRAFFDHIEKVETKSLQLTKDVLDERSRLEATIRNLQPQLDFGLMKVNSLKQEIKIIDENKSLIKDNKNFEYEVEETKQKKKELPRGQHVTNCTNCHFTCHDNCAYANDDEKANCCAMGQDGNCKICPDKCHWKKHANTPYIFEYVNVKVKKTYADMQKKYQEATGKLLSQEQIVEKLGEELGDLLDDIEDMMIIIKTCNERLEEIALRPNPLSMTEHIDLMIESEKFEKKDGFLQRINILNDFRKKAQITNEFETFREQAQSTLGTVGKKRSRDTKSIMARMGAWFKGTFT